MPPCLTLVISPMQTDNGTTQGVVIKTKATKTTVSTPPSHITLAIFPDIHTHYQRNSKLTATCTQLPTTHTQTHTRTSTHSRQKTNKYKTQTAHYTSAMRSEGTVKLVFDSTSHYAGCQLSGKLVLIITNTTNNHTYAHPHTAVIRQQQVQDRCQHGGRRINTFAWSCLKKCLFVNRHSPTNTE